MNGLTIDEPPTPLWICSGFFKQRTIHFTARSPDGLYERRIVCVRKELLLAYGVVAAAGSIYDPDF